VGALPAAPPEQKLGYDVTHKIFHPEPDKAQAGANRIEIAEHLSKKSSKKLGETLGTAGAQFWVRSSQGRQGGMVGALGWRGFGGTVQGQMQQLP
jgi:hypothetical protein